MSSSSDSDSIASVSSSSLLSSSSDDGSATVASRATSVSSVPNRNRGIKSASRAREPNLEPRNPETFPSVFREEDIEPGVAEYINEADEDTAIIDMFQDDNADKHYDNILLKDMICEVCDKSFASQKKDTFKKHHRRHFAPELFQCPTCKRGFTTLNLCIQHEINQHQLEKKKRGTEYESDTYQPSYKGIYELSDTSDDDVDDFDEDKIPIRLSTMFHPYQGERVKSYAGAILMEHKYQNKFQNRDQSSEMAKQFVTAIVPKPVDP